MGALKMSDEELREDLDAGLTVKEIAEKHGMTRDGIYTKIHRMRKAAKNEKPGGEPALDCFAHDRRDGSCSCLEVEKCQGKPCPFYKDADQALEEARREADPCGGYWKNTLAVIAMIERNQGMRA